MHLPLGTLAAQFVVMVLAGFLRADRQLQMRGRPTGWVNGVGLQLKLVAVGTTVWIFGYFLRVVYLMWRCRVLRDGMGKKFSFKQGTAGREGSRDTS